MTWMRVAIGVGAAVAIAAALVSGGSRTDTAPPRFLAIPALGEGGRTALVDSSGRVIGLRRSGADARADRRRVRRTRALGVGAPGWARRLYRRSLLVLRALTDGSGAVIAGAREGWAYVWPRDAAAVALAYAAAGYEEDARRVAQFLHRLDLEAAARFHPDETPVPGREAQGDAFGWVEVAARAAGRRGGARGVSEVNPHYGGSSSPTPGSWRDRGDYQEKGSGDYLGNAIAAGSPAAPSREAGGNAMRAFAAAGVLVREAGEPESGVDSAAAWAVRPFPHPALFPAVRRSLHRLVDERGRRFGIVPSEDWPEDDPWTAPTAWTAWAFAALGERRTALRLMGALRRAATPLGLLPERVDAETGEPRSTTPLAWSHAFAILALRELWPCTDTSSTCNGCRTCAGAS